MHTIETTGIVTPDHQLVVRSVPNDVSPGEHAIVVTIDPLQQTRNRSVPVFRSAYPINVTNDQMTFGREDIYEDADR